MKPQQGICSLGLAGVFLLAGVDAPFGTDAIAQLIPDNTLGAENSVVTPLDQLNEKIDGGAMRGANLFHSFQDFNVGEGRGVYFANPLGIENILSRVTGSNPSNILGRLGVLGNANLFLLNPNGIVFGLNASLDIKGSFFATTANAIKLGDSGYFSASQPQTSSLLSVSPGALFFNQVASQKGAITNAGNLAVASGQTLTLLGGTVTSTGSLTAPGGTVQVLGDRVGLLDHAGIDVSSDEGGGTVLIGGDFQGKGAVPNALRTFIAPDVTINANALTNGNGGRVIIWSDEVTGFYGNISTRGGSETGNGGFVEVSGKQNLIFRGTVDSSAVHGSFGTLLLDPTNITIVNGGDAPDDGQLTDSQILQKDGGTTAFTISETALEALTGDTNVILQATNNITLNDLTDNTLNFAPGTGSIAFTADADGDGAGSFVMQDTVLDTVKTNGRNISILGASVTVGNINTHVPTIKGGDVTISATNRIDTGEIDTWVNGGSGGNVTLTLTGSGGSITTGKIWSLTFESSFCWDFPPCSGGNVEIDANGGSIYAGNIDSYANLAYLPEEKGGAIILKGSNITTGDLNNNGLGGTGQLDAQGNLIELNASGSITTGNINNNDNSIRLSANGDVTTRGINSVGGDISITSQASSITIDKLSSVPNIRSGRGNITLNAQNDIALNGSIDASGMGTGGNVILTSQSGEISLKDVTITSDVSGDGTGGNIQIKADSVVLTNTDLTTKASGSSSAGDINITATTGSVSITDGTQINASTSGEGSAGKISVRATDSVILSNNAQIRGNVEAGATGNGNQIDITSRSLSLTDGAQVSASTSGEGNAGEILVRTTDAVSLSNNAQIRGNVEAGATGNGNQINIQARSLSLTNGAQVSASTSGQGKAGNIEIDVTDGVTISGTKTGVFASTENSIITPTPVGVAATEGDDAGQLLGTNRDLTTGSAGTVVTTISGTLANNNDVDLYKIFLAENQTFSATTIGGSGVEDTQLYLFDERGIGVYANDDADRGGTYQSTLPAGNPLTPAVPGYYYLAISSYANAALSNGGEIFGDSSSTVGATGTGGSLPLSSWNKMGDESGAYSIKLVGTGVTVPQQVVQQGGDGGNITLRAGSLSVRDGAQLAATTSGGGKAGNVTINATNAVSFEGSSALTSVKSGATGNGGNLDLTARSLSLTNNSQLSASTSGKGDAGSIFVRDADTVSLDNNSQIHSAVEAGAIGNSQQINLQTRSLSLTNNSQLSASTSGQGDAGSIFVRDANRVSLDNNSQIRSAVEAGAIGNSQQINLQTRSLSLTNNAQLSASTSGQGDAGSIFVRDANRVSLDNNSQIRSAVEAGAIGNSQQINLQTRSLSLTNNSQLSASTSGQGNAGSIFVRDADTVSVDDSSISTAVNPGGKGEGGNVEITTGSLDLDNKALLSASTSGVGNTGGVSVQAQEAISLRNGSQISSSVESTAVGKGQQITLQARTLSLTNGAQVNATTSGEGDAGSIKVNTDEAVSLWGDNSRLSTRTNSGGKGGNITVDTTRFGISQKAGLDATTSSTGNGGDITVNASTFDATSGGKLQATTSGSGRAGTITVNTADRVRVDGTGSGLFASTDANSTGDGGNINIDTTNLDLNNGAAISAQSDGKGTAGDITITARQAINSNRGEITANAASAGGGEITINTRNINLLNSSLISTSVANSDGGGGNIKITSDTFIALQDSDILANADAGSGGNIEINSPLFLADLFASGFGTAVGRNPGDFTQFRGNDRVDISASSRVGISGSVRIPDFSFLQNSLSQLSLNFVNPDQAIASSCLAHRNAKQGSFTLTGTGGLPYNPYEAMRGGYEVSEVQGLTPQEKQEASSPLSNPQSPILNSWKLGDPVQEAQGMTLTADGRILVGTTPQLAVAIKAQDLICPAESNQVGR